jgi:hypothetical protein
MKPYRLLRLISLISFLCGLSFTFAGAFIPFFTMLVSDANSAIIGGADLPTYSLLFFSLMNGLPFYLVVFGVILFISAIVCLVLSFIKKRL